MQDICCIIDQKSGKPACPMQNVEISAVIGSMIAEVTLVQNYINIANYSIEAAYIFPLPHNAQVTGFKGRIGENEVKGEFREKDEAFAEYEKAVRRGDSAVLLESCRPDIFQISLGNIASGEKASISITYLENIEVVDSELRWMVPTVIAPRYIPRKNRRYGRSIGMNAAMEGGGTAGTEYITPPIGETSYTLRIKAALRGVKGIRKVSSPSHPVEVLFNGGDVDVSLAKETELLDSDFILSVLLDEDAESCYIIAEGKKDAGFETSDAANNVQGLVCNDGMGYAGEAFGMAKLMIDMDDCCEMQKNYEYIFIIDISGSMTGEKLKQAKRALVISLRNLLEGDYFNIVAFESNFSRFSNEAVPYSQQNLEKADQWISALNAAGGTEIFDPLRFVLEEMASDNGLERVVLLFTDGQVGNENEIIRLVKGHNQSLQLFPFGIDTAVNKYFIDGLAASGNGIPEYIYPGERIEDKVIRQFSRIHQPYLANPAAFAKNGEELNTVPPMPARIYSSEEYGFMVQSECLGPIEEITIRGTIHGRDEEILLKPNVEGNARLLGLKWAKEKIELLEEKASGNNQRRNDLIKKKIVELSIRYSLLSTMTSLVAVHKRAVKEKGIPETIVIPVAKPRGWDMFDDTSDIMYCMAPSIVSEPAMRFQRDEGMAEKLEIPAFFKKSMSRRAYGTGMGKAVLPKAKEREVPSVNEMVMKAAQSQKADGAFGSGSEMNRRTAFFIIGMLLLTREWRPYRIQITKAGKALCKSDPSDLLLKDIALYMLKEQKLLGTKGFNFAELQTIPDNIAVKLPRDGIKAYEAFKSGSMQYLYDITGYKYSGNVDRNEFACWLLTKVVEQAW